MPRRLSLHKVELVGGRFRGLAGEAFDAAVYSRFKYGDLRVTEHYAGHLVERLWTSWIEASTSLDPPVIVSGPVKHLQTAACTLAKAIVRRLDSRLVRKGLGRASIVPLHMDVVECTNYSGCPQHEREEILKRAGLHVDESTVEGRAIIVVDDARITGTAEANAVRVLREAGAEAVDCVYVVEADPTSSGDYGAALEDTLNHSYIDSLERLLEMFRSTQVQLNIRTLKFVLSWPDAIAVEHFLEAVEIDMLRTLHVAVQESGVELTEPLSETVERLRAVAAKRGLARVAHRHRPQGTSLAHPPTLAPAQA